MNAEPAAICERAILREVDLRADAGRLADDDADAERALLGGPALLALGFVVVGERGAWRDASTARTIAIKRMRRP